MYQESLISMSVTQGALLLLAAYLIAAIPFGFLLFRMQGGGDIRKEGSGNIGATNVFRAGGRAAGIATLVLDIAKGVLAVGVVLWWTQDLAWSAAGAFVAVVGHCYPVYLGFRGGKGIATGCGAYGILAPLPMGLTLLVFLAAVLTTRMVSVGSIAAGLALPLLIWLLQPERSLLYSVAAAAALVIWKHRGNIERLLRRKESRLGAS